MNDISKHCSVVEYRVSGHGDVSKHYLGALDLGNAEWQAEAERYLREVCQNQVTGSISVVMVSQDLYGVNAAAYVCRDGEVVGREGGSGCTRIDELITEVRQELSDKKRH